MWIRGPGGLIQNIPHVLWVIAGREKLRWMRFDKDWEDSLEQHLLVTLSKKDASYFLNNSGITDEELINQLIELTQGTPVDLDLCVDTYHELLSRNKTPVIEDFGKNIYTLIERFARYMDDSKKEMIYFLSCLNTWNDETAIQLGKEIVPHFSILTYERVKNLSFVNQYENQYTIHETISKVFYENCPQSFKDIIVEKVLSYYLEQLNIENIFSIKHAQIFSKVLFLSIKYYEDPQTFHDFYIQNIHKIYVKMMKSGIKAGNFIVTQLREKRNNEENILLPLFFMEYTYAVIIAGTLENVEQIANTSVQLYKDMCGEKSMNTVYALEALAYVKRLLGKNFEASYLYQSIYELKKELLGEDNVEILISYKDYASSLLYTFEYKKCLPLYRDILEKYPIILEDNKSISIDILVGYAKALSDDNQHEEALKYLEICLEKCHKIYGVNHLRTVEINEFIASQYIHVGKEAKAMNLQKNVYEMKKAILSKKHHETALSLFKYAEYKELACFWYLAIDEKKESLAVIEKVYGSTHKETMKILKSLDSSLVKAKRYEELLEVREKI